MVSEVAMGRPNTALAISDADRVQLRALVRSHSRPHSLVRRAQIVLLSGEGGSNRGRKALRRQRSRSQPLAPALSGAGAGRVAR